MTERLTFRPTIFVTVLTIAVCALFVRLGIWQLHRAAETHREYEQFVQHTQAPPVPLQQAEVWQRPAAQLLWRQAELFGRYLTGKEVLLDNQSEQGRAGYIVFTPFELGDGGPAVLVNRGWRPNPPDRDRVDVPPPSAVALRIRGIIGPPPAHGIQLGGADAVEHLGSDLMRVQLIDTARLSRQLHTDLLPYTVMLDPAAPDGFARNWRRPGSTEGRNQSYAVQWFAMAAAVAALFIYYNLKRVP